MANGENSGTIGTVLGTAVGTAFGMPQIGAMAGQAIGSTIGGIQQKNAANKMSVPAVDPTQATMLEQIRRRRRAMETGGAFGNLEGGIKSTLATTQRNILRRGGGQVGSTLSALGMAGASAVGQLGNLQTKQMELANQLAGQEQALNQRIAQRRLELGLLAQNRLSAQGKEDFSGGMENLMSVVASEGDLSKLRNLLANLNNNGTEEKDV